MTQLKNGDIRKTLRERYGTIAESGRSECCEPSESLCCGKIKPETKDALLGMGYSATDMDNVPENAIMGLGCGNPKAIASLKPGETVLDLGCGGGFDCFLAAREVGETGRIIGIDMTPEMVSKARENTEIAGFRNTEFRLGEIEYLPIGDSVIDVIISNCVINLSPEKAKVFKEAFRVLKPGGRLAISDVIKYAEFPESFKYDILLLTHCIVGALTIKEIETMLKDVGFEKIKIEPRDESRDFIRGWIPGKKIEDYIVSATIEAIKPAE